MDMFILGILAVLAVPVGVIVLFVRMAGLSARTERLEREVAVLRAGMVPVAGGAAAAAAAVPVAPEGVPPAAAPVAAAAPDVAAAPPSVPPSVAPAPFVHPVLAGPRRPDMFEQFGRWLRENWVYAVSGVSLALAGIFLVQYGMERGYLPPAARVAFGILFGMALVAGGEWVRRRFAGQLHDTTAYLPEVFSGAGIVSVFAALIAARQMYGLTGPEATFAGLAVTAAGAVVLGWFNGPFMAALGLVGAALAPFVVGGSAEAADWLYAYFGLVAAVGLGIDAVRRWAWVSVLALVLGFGAGGLLVLGGGGAEGWALLCAALVPLAVAVPCLRVMPDHAGPTCLDAALRADVVGWPVFPVRLAAGAVLAATVALTLGAGEMLPFVLLALLAALLADWTGRAPGLQDLALVPAAGFLLRLGIEGFYGGPLEYGFAQAALRGPEVAAPLTASWLLLLATGMTLAIAWRAERGAWHPVVLAAAAAVVAPVAALLLELFWPVSGVVGAYPWALQVLALAALMTALAMRFAKADLRRAVYFVLSALSLIAFALFVVTGSAALTMALAVLVVAAAWLDRRFGMPEMGWFVQAGVMVIGWRVTVDPGLGFAMDGPWGAVIVTHIAPLAGFAVALWLLRGLPRVAARAFLESGFAATAAIFADVVIVRLLDATGSGDAHWVVALVAYPWLVLALVQLYRTGLDGWMRWLRLGLAAVGAVIAGVGMLAVVTVLNPLVWGGQVSGPLLLDTLLVAYAVPGVTLVLFVVLARARLGHVWGWLRSGLFGIGIGLCALYAGLEIRRFWRGDDLSVHGTTQPELYSYTVALLILGAVLLWQAIAKASPLLRRVAMGVIAVTVAKVFVIDASGLSGLIRVFSFLGLGLSLAGLAWLNRWAAGRMA